MSHFSFRRLTLPVMLFTACSGLHAGAGLILIDQASALAGGVTSGDSPGFPVTLSTPGSYKLTGNLTVTDGNTTGIQILADFVTLDLDGFSIIGPITCTASPVVCTPSGTGIGVQTAGNQGTGPRGVRVLNGAISGMGLAGVQMTGVGSKVERVSAYNNAGAGIVSETVVESEAKRNGTYGILATTVRDSRSSENAADGIVLNSGGGIATGNTASFNGGSGISASFATITGNSMFLNRSFGVSALCPSVIVANTVVSIDGSNFTTQGSGCTLGNNASR
jgi:hypothetical protein